MALSYSFTTIDIAEHFEKQANSLNIKKHNNTRVSLSGRLHYRAVLVIGQKKLAQ